MTTKVSTLEMRQRLGDILNRVSLRHDQFVIERKGQRLAALVPVEKLERLDRLALQSVSDLLGRMPRVALSEQEASALADEAKHATRKGRRAKSGPRRKRRP